MHALVVGLSACVLAVQDPTERPRRERPPGGGEPRRQQPLEPALHAGALTVSWSMALGAPSFGGASAADLDADGALDLVFGTYFGDSRALALRGASGEVLWQSEQGDGAGKACLDASFRVVDVNGDQRLDVLVPVSNRMLLLALDARTGKEHWRADLGAATDSPPCVVDTDGDGVLDVVLGTFAGELRVLRGTDGLLLRRVPVAEGAVQTCPVVMDVDGDGALDFLAGTFNRSNCYVARSGRDGSELWRVPFTTEGRNPLGVYHGPAVGDLDGDGTAELVLSSYDGIVRCIRARDGFELWRVKTGDRYFMAPPAMADLDADGRLDVVVSSQQLTRIDGSGNVVFRVPLGGGRTGAAADRGPSLSDLDGDGLVDIATLRGDGLFSVHRGTDGARLYEFDAATLTQKRIASSSHGPILADLTGDGRLDAFFVVGAGVPETDRHGLAVMLTGFAGSGPGWPMLRHDVRNTGTIPLAQLRDEPARGWSCHVLGRAQDGGLPHFGCNQPCCEDARRTGRRETPAALGLHDSSDGQLVLVEATPAVEEQVALLHQLANVRDRGRKPVDAVVLTHAHIGHYLGLAHFGREVASTQQLPLHVTPKMGEFLSGHGPWKQLLALEQFVLNTHEPEKAFALAPNLQATPLRVPHRDEFSDTVAWRFAGPRATVLFCPDVDRWDAHPGLLDKLLQGVDVAYLDATFYDGRELPDRNLAEIPHPPMVRTMELLAERARAKPGAIRFLHLNHSNPAFHDPALADQLQARGFRLAEVGERVPL